MITGDMAVALIRATPLTELRRTAAQHKQWAKVLRGYRPQALTHELLAGRAGEFAASPLMLRELAEAFLKSAGVAAGGRLEERLIAAAAREELPEAVRAVCRELAGGSPKDAVPPGAEAQAEPASAPAKRPARKRAAKAG